MSADAITHETGAYDTPANDELMVMRLTGETPTPLILILNKGEGVVDIRIPDRLYELLRRLTEQGDIQAEAALEGILQHANELGHLAVGAASPDTNRRKLRSSQQLQNKTADPDIVRSLKQRYRDEWLGYLNLESDEMPNIASLVQASAVESLIDSRPMVADSSRLQQLHDALDEFRSKRR